jgi:hypothetical protein
MKLEIALDDVRLLRDALWNIASPDGWKGWSSGDIQRLRIYLTREIDGDILMSKYAESLKVNP